ncbi:hypothetical protein [Streptomyces sp. NBC_01518]|uniref:hypothetical protein n=1 Tax=Streptomyces sp. NBC_01518 TaxID=2903891 RepID=UPI00386C778A
MISNPPINLADPKVFYDLRSVIDVLDAGDEARVVVFESATADFFLAHLDVSQNLGHSPGSTDCC